MLGWIRQTRRPDLFFPLLVVVFGTVAFSNSLQNGFTFDDEAIVVENPTVKAIDLGRIFSEPYWPGRAELGLFRPITTLTFALNYQIHGLDPFGYHLFNVVLHLLNGMLVFWIAWRVLGDVASAGLSALVFVLHPVQTEAVNGIVGRSELLCGFWLVLAWLLYISAIEMKRRSLLAASVVASLAACLCKEQAAVLVGLLAGYDCLFGRGNGRWIDRESLRRYGPYVAILLLFLVWRSAVVGSVLLPKRPLFLDNPLAYASTLERVSTAIAVLGTYFVKLLLPLSLSADYSYDQIPVVGTAFDFRFWFGVAVVVGVAWAAVQGLRSRIDSGWGLGALIPVVTLLPVSNLFFSIGTIMGERLLYLPCLGFALWIGTGFRVLTRTRSDWAAAGLAALLLLGYGARTMLRNADWKDNHSLFASAVATAPRSAKVHFNLGGALRMRGDLNGAYREYQEALLIHPYYTEVHYNIGVIHQKRGEAKQALTAYTQALFTDSLHVASWVNTGTQLGRLKRFEEAVDVFERALRLDPDHLLARYNFALASQELGRNQEAMEAYLKVLDADPGYTDAAVNLGSLYSENGYRAEAIAVYRRHLKVRPDAYQVAYNLGVTLEKAGGLNEAIEAYALASESTDEMGAFSLYKVGSIEQQLGNREAAGEAFEAFLERWTGNKEFGRAAKRRLSSLGLDR